MCYVVVMWWLRLCDLYCVRMMYLRKFELMMFDSAKSMRW